MAQKVVVKVKGKQRTFTSVADAAKAAGMNYTTFYQRLQKGTASAAFKEPVRPYRQQASA